jgi:hypothetical protein
VFNGTNFLSNGTNFHEKEYGDRSCCDQQSGKVFRSEQKLTELAFRHCRLLSHALLRFWALPQNLWTPIGTNGPRHAVLAPDLDIFRQTIGTISRVFAPLVYRMPVMRPCPPASTARIARLHGADHAPLEHASQATV